jgi:putative nucleotidyltransferase with HDIG domain
MRISYRVGQARAMAGARMSETDREEALAGLPYDLRPLFLSMTVRDQRHALRVLRRLEAQGPLSDLLRQAALLHDVGKARAPLGIPGRSLVVLAEVTHLLPVLLLVPVLGGRVRRYVRHPELGAEMLRDAGADPVLVEIVREHQSPSPKRSETSRLQAVDGRE